MLLLTFIILNIVNVIIQTVKSIVTIKGGKVSASITNAVAYGLYTVVVIYMVCDLPIVMKAVIIGLCNLICVFIVKAIEEKMRKDKIWRIDISANKLSDIAFIRRKLEINNISFSEVEMNNGYTVFNVYSYNQQQSHIVRENIIRQVTDCKYFITENKGIL